MAIQEHDLPSNPDDDAANAEFRSGANTDTEITLDQGVLVEDVVPSIDALPTQIDTSNKKRNRVLGAIAAGTALLTAGAVGFGLNSGGESEPEAAPSPEPAVSAEPFAQEELEPTVDSTVVQEVAVESSTPNSEEQETGAATEANLSELDIFTYETSDPFYTVLDSERTLDANSPEELLSQAVSLLNEGYSESNQALLSGLEYYGELEDQDSLSENVHFQTGLYNVYSAKSGGEYELDSEFVESSVDEEGRLSVVADSTFHTVRRDGEENNYNGLIDYRFVRVTANVQIGDTMVENHTFYQLEEYNLISQ